MNTYANEVKKQNILKLRELLSNMPSFCSDYFRGISESRSERTRVGYCRNIYTFLQFITLNNPVYKNYAIKDLPIQVLDEMTPADIDEFTTEIWENLDADNKISLYVRYTDLETGEVENRMINKNQQGIAREEKYP